jgi:hypothetical protein
MTKPHATLEHRGKESYTQPVSRSAMRDGRLTFGARGLYSYLWQLSSGQRPPLRHLATQGPDGGMTVRRYVKELQSVGALIITNIRDDSDSIRGSCWTVVAGHIWAIDLPLIDWALGKRPRVNFRRANNREKIMTPPTYACHKTRTTTSQMNRSEELGIRVSGDLDRRMIQKLVEKFGADAVTNAALELNHELGAAPLPSVVRKRLLKGKQLRKEAPRGKDA